ncbi:MAG: MoaD/ThiS family protein [Verrucomicrobiota bacterium]
MGKITVLAFSTSRQVMGFTECVVEYESQDTVESLLTRLVPNVREHCSTARVALDQEFAEWSDLVDGHEELAILPPVSGG